MEKKKSKLKCEFLGISSITEVTLYNVFSLSSVSKNCPIANSGLPKYRLAAVSVITTVLGSLSDVVVSPIIAGKEKTLNKVLKAQPELDVEGLIKEALKNL